MCIDSPFVGSLFFAKILLPKYLTRCRLGGGTRAASRTMRASGASPGAALLGLIVEVHLGSAVAGGDRHRGLQVVLEGLQAGCGQRGQIEHQLLARDFVGRQDLGRASKSPIPATTLRTPRGILRERTGILALAPNQSQSQPIRRMFQRCSPCRNDKPLPQGHLSVHHRQNAASLPRLH